MRSHTSIALLTVMLCFAAALCLAAAQARADVQQIMRSGADYVRIESEEASAPPNAHPTSLPPAQIAALLSQLQVEIKGLVHNAAPSALFTEASIARLAPAISDALGKAQTHEDITFAISERRSGTLGQDVYVTSGKIFVRDGELNIIMGEMVRPLRSLINRRSHTTDPVLQPRAGYFSAAVMDQIAIEPGSRRRALSGNALVENALIRFPKDAAREDWAVASLAGIADAKRVDVQSAVVTPVATEPGTIEARLQRLKTLREQGLISEGAYQEKQREVLGEL
jgi:hypothetical protein